MSRALLARMADALATPAAPRVGEVGCPSSCPLCATGAGHAPCLACRDTLRSGLRAFDKVDYSIVSFN